MYSSLIGFKPGQLKVPEGAELPHNRPKSVQNLLLLLLLLLLLSCKNG